ncbi:MAG: hypothetical protein DHS20C05_23200 [Hyphococcus sp.]|nr:MAG: hypothetical protein DHS20C05_23200 [Marinicaulis sp.]
MTSSLDDRRKKLLYQATYRGFKEADLLIGGFAKAHLANLTDSELDEFEALLHLNDHDLYNWATGKVERPDDIDGPVFKKLQAFKL